MKKYLKEKGFTLVELMVVIVIVGILAAVAIPKFTVASHKAKASEFGTVLTSIYSAEHTFQTENGNFVAASTADDSFDTLGVTIPSSKWFSYEVGGVSSSTFTATSTVTQAFGEAAQGNTATIDEGGDKAATGGLSSYAPNWDQN